MYDRVLEINPNHIHALVGKGSIRENSGEYHEANEIYEKILKIEPNHTYAREHRMTPEEVLEKTRKYIKIVIPETPENRVIITPFTEDSEDQELSSESQRKTPKTVSEPMLDPDIVGLLQVLLVLAVIFIFIVGLATVFSGGLKGSTTKELTPAQRATAIKDCKNWGGRVIYDDRNQYQDCAM